MTSKAAPILLLTSALLTGCPEGSGPEATSDAGSDAPGDAADTASPPDGASDAYVDADTDADGPPATTTIGPERAFDLVDPFIGTGGQGFGYAALTPAAQVPNGMVRLGPDTSKGAAAFPQHHFSGYHASDTDILRFSHTRLVGTGVGAQGHLGWRPAAIAPNDEDDTPWEGHVGFKKDSETAEPGYYAVELSDPKLRAEMTASLRGGLQRYTPAGNNDKFTLVFDATSTIWENDQITAELEVSEGSDGADRLVIEGQVHHDGDFTTRSRPYTIYFTTHVSPAPRSVDLWNGSDEPPENGRVEGQHAGVTLEFADVADGSNKEAVEVRTGLSYVDMKQARLHRREELDGRSFAEVRRAAAERWRDKLGRIELTVREERLDDSPDKTEDATKDTPGNAVELFYTALYNVWRMPTRLDGRDGRYRGFDGEIHSLPDGSGQRFFTDLSLWDTFRTLHPLLVIIDPELQRDCLRSLIRMGEQGGTIPQWPAGLGYTGSMIGTSADVLFGGSAVKGVDGVDYAKAFELLKKTATGPTSHGRAGIEAYLDLGYVPADQYEGAASMTLEYTWDDWALANLADHLNRSPAPDDGPDFRTRAGNWKKLYDPQTGFLRPKNADGRFVEPFNPEGGAASPGGLYTEGNAWHWRFYPIFQAEELVKTYGGPEAFETPLRTFFEESRTAGGPLRKLLPDNRFWPGNEHDIHTPYLWHFTDHPEEVGRWVRKVQNRVYQPTPDGYPGNDDGGTMSSVYLFHALGFYPVAGGDRYLRGAPLFRRAELRFGDDDTLTVEAPGAGPKTWRVGEVRLDGEAVDGPYLEHDELKGGTLEFGFETAKK